ncbi:MAG: DNA translocase FtsK 4TM domain-containing protein [Chitinophagales bacterium]
MEMEAEQPKGRKAKAKTDETAAPVKKKPKSRPATDFEEEESVPFWKDGRLAKIAGMSLLLASFVMAVGFTSYLFHGADDQSEIANRTVDALTDNSVKVHNSIGRVGAVAAHVLVQNLFGLASYLLCLLTFVIGFNLLLQKKIFNILKITLYGAAIIVWTSAALSFLNQLIYPSSVFSWGGAFGDYLTGTEGQLTGLLQTVGTAALLAVTALAGLVWAYNFNFNFLMRPFERTHSEEQTAPVVNEVPEFRDESENIFGKDQLHTEIKPAVELLTPDNLVEEEESDEELVLTTKVPAEIPHQLGDLEITNAGDADLELDIQQVKEEPVATTTGALTTKYDPTLDLSNYAFPSIELLEEYGSEKMKIDPEELERNKNQIIATLNNYQIEISKIKATIGPTVTLYEIVPAPGVRISKIKNLEDDIALSLAALGIRIIAPIPGKGTVGIEVPNMNKEVVSMRSLLASEKFQNTSADLPICLGKTISNEILVADLAKMPHLLMAGATGQGKSVGINSILVSLLYKKHPSQLKFVMVDPKKVELSLYETLEKHFLAKLPNEENAIITDTKKVVTTLNALCMEMDNRYDLLKKAQVRNIKEYNHKFLNRQLNPQNGHQFLPYIVLVVDEFADLIMTAGKEVEMPIARLAQLARAIGIHLILATQRPSVNIITGTIKANFPARIAFKTTSKIDSRTILDAGGSEQLIGRGDMLLSQGSDMIRLQCGFVDTPEVERVRDFISAQQGYPDAFLLPDYVDPNELKGDGDFLADGERDELFEDAARIIVQNQMGSTSLLQRRMKLGYNRAGRLMDQLHDAGIVGENLGSKAREVKIKTEAELEQYLQKLREVV